MFEDKLGTVKDHKFHLRVKENAKPVFFKPRTVVYAMKPKIETEINRLVKLGVLEKVECSEWTTPVVPVLKTDSTVRLYGDYKVTVNPVLEIPEHPLPKPKELFNKLNGGKKFTKLDLSHAYQQVLLDEKSKKYTTINTHLGLFQYN